MNNSYEKEFWKMLDFLVENNKLVIDRKKGSAHPKYPKMIYPADYGFLEGTSSMDGGGIDVWLGTDSAKKLDAVICTVDIIKNDSEIKFLIGCTAEEKDIILDFHNNSRYMKGIIINRA